MRFSSATDPHHAYDCAICCEQPRKFTQITTRFMKKSHSQIIHFHSVNHRHTLLIWVNFIESAQIELWFFFGLNCWSTLIELLQRFRSTYFSEYLLRNFTFIQRSSFNRMKLARHKYKCSEQTDRMLAPWCIQHIYNFIFESYEKYQISTFEQPSEHFSHSRI